MSIFLKFSNYCIIIDQTVYFENIQYCKINFLVKLVTTILLHLLKGNPISFSFFFKNVYFSQIFKLLHNSQTTYFENIQYCKIYFHYGVILAKTSYNDSTFFFWKIFSFQNSIFFKNVYFSQIFKLPYKYRPNCLF